MAASAAADVSEVEPAINAVDTSDAADASAIREPAPSEPRGSFVMKARLARLDAGADERVCRGEARPFHRPRIVASQTLRAQVLPAQALRSDVPASGAAAAVVSPQAWPRVIGRAPVALPVPKSWQDQLLQVRALQDPALQDPLLQHRVRPDPARPAVVTEFDRQTSSVDEYLCGVYWRMPRKIDDAGDFSWKDGVAAALAERTVCDYAINGMHPDLREALYVLGHKADAAGINWSLLSGFRDDYRQRIAKGFKAKDCESWHGGSCRTNGWGDGRAADLWMADQDGYPVKDASPLLALVDQMASALGLSRPMRWADPPHVQLNGEWQEIAGILREQRLRNSPEASERSSSNR